MHIGDGTGASVGRLVRLLVGIAEVSDPTASRANAERHPGIPPFVILPGGPLGRAGLPERMSSPTTSA
jgi:hypothetical protein